MKLLDDGIIQDKYDVVVVGAGIGGITAGALLAKRGLKTLVIEQHYLPGGVCSTIKRNGICMDAGAAMLFGWGKDQDTPHRFVMNELEEEIDVIPHDCYYRMHFDDRAVTFWKDFDKFFKELSAAFPGKEDQLRGFYDHTRKIYDDLMTTPLPMSPDTVPLKLTLKMLLRHPFITMRMPKYMNSSLKDVLDLYVKDKEIEGLFDLLIATCYCTKIEETPLLMSAAIVWEAFYGGAIYPSGSPQMLPNTIEKALEKYGGQMLYRHLVEEILIKDGAAYGVRLDNGEEILAEKVVSDATIWNLYGKLIKPEHIPKERMKWAHGFEPTVSCVLLYMGVDAKVIPEGTNAIEVFIPDVTDITRNVLFVYLPSIDDPSICPEGTHSLSVLCSTIDTEWPRPGDPNYQNEEYNKKKENFANNILDVMETKFPGIKDNIITLEIATPATIERFTLKNKGNIGGPKQALGQHLLNRLKARSEFKNLYCVGDSTVMGEGVISATSSAVGAANMILKDMKKKQYLPRKFKKEYINYVEGKKRISLPSFEEELTEKTAKREAIECQWCEDPKCIKNCPANIDVPNFIRRIEVGNYVGAAKEIRKMNPFGEMCGLLCPAEKLCEKECNRFDFSERPTQIKKLQAWACKMAGEEGWPSISGKSNGKKIAVIGAGPAGLSCAYYLSQLGYQVDILEKEAFIGGIPAQAIPQMRLPDEILSREFKQIKDNPLVNIKYGMELGQNVKMDDLVDEYGSLFLAIGLNFGKILEIPGNGSVNVIDALSFLKDSKENGKANLENEILVIGGGSVAADASMVAIKRGAKNTSLVCLESENEMPCLSKEIDELKNNGVKIYNSWGPKSYKDENTLTCVKCNSVYDNEGKFCPEFDDSALKEFKFDKMIMAVGQKLQLDHQNYLEKVFGQYPLRIDKVTHLIEGQSKIYAGGDLTRGNGTIVEAIADGRKVAIAIDSQLRNI